MSDTVWQLLEDAIGARPGAHPVAGGCINHCAVMTLNSGRKVFVKTNSADKLLMFEAEGIGLRALDDAGAICVPEFVRFGVVGDYSFLVLQHLPIGKGKPKDFRRLGERLAQLHSHCSDDGRFGANQDNFIGATDQRNAWADDWAKFFAEQRIGFQFDLAGGRFEHGDKLVARIPDLLDGHEPRPSLLHGDLWSGNVGFLQSGEPVVYDPASYYGDRETDIAFTEMFGGFDPEFYRGYRHAYPLDDGYEKRRDLYNLYHVVNHYNLFGGGYGDQAEAMVRRLLVGF